MRPYFDAIFTCGEVGHGKDEPIIFRRAMESFHADRTTTVVFEDAFHAAKTAKDDGFFVAAVFDSSEKQQEALRLSSDCFLENYEDLSLSGSLSLRFPIECFKRKIAITSEAAPRNREAVSQLKSTDYSKKRNYC